METLSAAVGQRIKALRVERGTSADRVAETARTFGLGWQRSTVASIETGRRGLTAEELMLLPVVMTAVLETDVHLGDLLRVEAALSDDVSFRPAGFAALLEGKRLKLPTHMVIPKLFERINEQLGPENKAWQRIEKLWPEVHGDVALNLDNLMAVEKAGSGEAEQKAGRSLGVSGVEVAAVAFRRWGRGLTAERDARVAEKADQSTSNRSVQAIRGRVTRTLVAEIRPLLDEQLEED